MSPTPLLPNAVHITLQYIAPPSQLDRPLPPYLVSKSLLQRHHFLSISPENPQEYLAWPADTSARAIHLLESLQIPDQDVPPTYPVHYTSDAEQTYAHVALPPVEAHGDALRLVFQWDIEGWKFHDLKLMPFPADSVSELPDALASVHSATHSLTSTAVSRSPPYNPYGFNDGDSSNDDDDDYWNAYGAGDDDHLRSAPQLAKEAVTDSEDAYWARYSSVQGTADSTVPSPPVLRRKHIHPFADIDPDSPQALPVPVRLDSDTPGEVLPIPNARLLHPHHNPRWDPASPQALARLLSEISPRQNPTLATEFEDELELSPPLDSSDDSDAPSPPDVLGLITEPLKLHTTVVVRTDEADAVTPVDDDEEPLKQSLRGIYNLWRSSRSRKGISDAKDKEAFVRIVEEVVGLP